MSVRISVVESCVDSLGRKLEMFVLRTLFILDSYQFLFSLFSPNYRSSSRQRMKLQANKYNTRSAYVEKLDIFLFTLTR